MTNERAPAIGGTPVEAAQYVIRAATVEDANGIAEAHVASWQTAYRGLLPQALLDGLSVERRTAQWQRDIQSGNVGVHVATDPAGHVGGFIATGRSRDDDATETVGELIAVYLRPQLWSLGIGGRLHAAGVAGLATRFEQATLWVLDGNARSRLFYERQGWQPDGTVKRNTIGGDADVIEVRYRRPLNGHAQNL
jgi:GNAT superfamily N-acetyltransferase